MLSKSKVNVDLLTCCKCDLVFDSDPIPLSCGHFICLSCSSKLKLHVYLHCGSLKLLTQSPSRSQTDLHSEGVFMRRLKRNLNEQRLRKCRLFIENFCNSLFNSNLKQISSAECSECFNLIRVHFNCSVCNLVFNGSKRSPVLLPCSHSICAECLESDKQGIFKCSECNKTIRITETIRAQCDYLTFNLLTSIDSILGELQSVLLSEMEAFFANWPLRIMIKQEEILNESLRHLEHRALSAISNEHRIQHELNNCRVELLEKADSMLKNMPIRLNNVSGWLPFEMKSRSVEFRESRLELSSSGFLGRLRFDERSIIDRIKYLHLNRTQVFKCDFFMENESEKESEKRKERVGLNLNDWSQARFKDEHFLVISFTRIFFILTPCLDTYRMKLVNPLSNKLIRDKEIRRDLRLIYCQTNCTDRLALLFEKDYNKDYVLELYELTSLDFVCSRSFPLYLDKVHLDERQLLAWSSVGPPFIQLFDLNLSPLRVINEDCDLFKSFYSLSVQTYEYFVFNNQTQIALVKRNSKQFAKAHKLIDLDAYSDKNDRAFDAERKEGTFIWHCESEYLNIKSIRNKYLLVSTSSKILLFDLNSAQLMAKNYVFRLNASSNNWFLPNRLYVGNDLSLVFFDLSTRSLTYF